MENGWFGYGSDPVLKGVNLEAERGHLICIYGTTGGGKSTLLLSLLGEIKQMAFQRSNVTLKGRVAYAGQKAWIRNTTVRENILFGLPMDQARYEAVIDTCALRIDLKLLEGGDLTEIGEKGANLSGGQAQRINLARAVYSNADVVLLDDVLSAVDSHVGEHIFRECITGPLLRGTTRILVTHQVRGFLSYFGAGII